MSLDSQLTVKLQNNTGSEKVYAYVTGKALDRENALMLLRADNLLPYYPDSPQKDHAPLGADCSIPLNSSGSDPLEITIPRLAGGRIWFSIGSQLEFFLNQGPALVEPSITNNTDSNIGKQWDFFEITYDDGGLYANISMVDFVCIPIALALTGSQGEQSVPGLPGGGLDTVCAKLAAQAALDEKGWNELIVTNDGENLRALSPESGIAIDNSLLRGYFDEYVKQTWQHYETNQLHVNTQSDWGKVNGTVVGDRLTFDGIGSFAQPSAADIFSCSSGPFDHAGMSAEMLAIVPRIAAALNRSTLLSNPCQPDNENPADYYSNRVTNHYACIVHATAIDGRGYAFPYDDVAPTEGADQTGKVTDPDPGVLTVTLGSVH